METVTPEGYPVDLALCAGSSPSSSGQRNNTCLSLPRAPAQIDACAEDIFNAGAVVTIHIDCQHYMSPLKVTCSNISGVTASFELRSDDTLVDLDTCIRDLCQWQSMSLFTDNGEDIVDLGLSVREFTRITAMNSGDRKKYEHWKERYPSVGKVLAAMKVEAFNPKSANFNVRWRLDTVRGLEPEEFDALLNAQDPAIVTDIDRSHYVQVLGHIVELSEGWRMVDLQLLQNFDPGMKLFKHQFYGALLAVARDALLPVEPHHPGIGAYFKRNKQGVAVGCDTPGISAYIDRNVQNSLNLPGIKLERNWSGSTRSEVLRVLKQISWTDRTDLGKPGDLPSHKLDGAMSHEFCCMLFTIELRLVCEVCPVSVNGDMTSDMIELLAESMDYCFDVLRSLGNATDFVLDEISENGGDANIEAQGLREHLNSSLAKAISFGASGSLLVVAGVPAKLAIMLAPVCRRLKEQALPNIVHFILCAGFVRQAT